jgi:hypothetical protein
MKEFLIPTMKITNYWVTFEWQKRNAIHAHLLIWIENQIDLTQAMRDKNYEDIKKSLNLYSSQINCENTLIKRTSLEEGFNT